MHIVVFPGWYPGRADKLSGDFIQRHLHAISQYCKVSAVIPVKDNSINKQETVTIKNGNLTEIYYYYPSVSSLKWLDSLLSFIRYNYLCVNAAKALSKNEKISIVYLYVLQKNYFIGILLQWLHKIPYVISECSTFYIDGRFDKASRIQKSLFWFIFKRSASVHAVSNYLANALNNKLQLKNDAIVIANVVDSALFYYNPNFTTPRPTFVHVSNMTHQKNAEGMLRAFAEVKKINADFFLNLVGPLPVSVSLLINELDLSKHIITWNERTYNEVAEIIQQSDVFVFFTRHETFGCVITEANACGLPVIVSDLEVTRELVSDGFNGVFVKSENVKDLTEKIILMMRDFPKFDPLAISLQTRQKFNYDRIGKQFLNWFTSTITPR